MRRHLLNIIVVTAVLLCSAILVSAQTDQLRGSVKLADASGSQKPVNGAQIDVYRTDMKADYHTKTNNKGEWVFAGLPFVGTYTVAVSAPGASPTARAGVKARADQPLEFVLSPGDGKKLTEAEATAASKGGVPTNSGGDNAATAAEKAKSYEMRKKNDEITKENAKIENVNKVVGDAFKNGNAALLAKNYDEAIKVVRTGLQQQPDSMALHIILAGALERKGDYEGAISEYELMADKQPGNLIVANNLASLLLDRRTDKASLKKAQSLAAVLRKSQIPQFKDTLGWLSYLQGDYRTAVSLSEEAAAALPDQAAVRYHLGMGYISTNQPDKASEQLKKALELAPNNELAEAIRNALQKLGS